MADQILIDSNEPKRAFALDALRGFAILTMVLSGVIPFGRITGLDVSCAGSAAVT